jgi:diguanylate cyclase (GGDEF)-like protein
MGTLFTKRNGSIVCLAFAIFFVLFMIYQNISMTRTIRSKLRSYQVAVMKSTVDNLVETIDSIRSSIKNNWDAAGRIYTEDDVKKEVENFVRAQIYRTENPTDAYLWINEVRDFNGGDNYAVRLIHANLKSTEGVFLSTNTKDEGGNLPYLEELEGVKEKGSILYTYYFKELKSNEVSKKITYARLYPDYNWIVCNGKYFNALYNYAGGLTLKETIAFIAGYIMLFLVLMLALLYVIVQSHRYGSHLQQENVRLTDEVKTDALTGAESRIQGTKLLKQCLNDFHKNEINRNIAMFDIDYFKTVNDRYGHYIGDVVLNGVVKAVKQNLGENESIIRWGGDEFIIIFDSVKDKAVLEALLGKMNKMVHSLKFKTEDGAFVQTSISIGAGKIRREDGSITDLLKHIYDALYLAKRNKNCHVILK